MKQVIFIGLILIALLLSGCVSDSNQGFEQDLLTGQNTSHSGLNFEDTQVLVEGNELSGKSVELGQAVNVYFSGVTGFTEADGKVFPGGSMTVLSLQGEQLLDSGDIYAKYTDGVSADDAETLSFKITPGDPLVPGETYKLKIRIWDKKAEGEINFETELKIKEASTQGEGSFNPATAITDTDLASLGVEGQASLKTEKGMIDVGLGGLSSDVYTYKIQDCEFILREYAAKEEALNAFSKLRQAYDTGLFSTTGWAVGKEDFMADKSFETVQETQGGKRIVFVSGNYLFESTSKCSQIPYENVVSIAELVEQKIAS